MQRLITMRNLGKPGWGRFANQCFQLGFLNLYADLWDCELRHPPWVGEALLDYAPRPITDETPVLEPYREIIVDRQPVMPHGYEVINKDFMGYAQFHTSWLADNVHREKFRSLFRPQRAVADRMDAAAKRLAAPGSTVVGLHLRRGDYGQREFYITPTSWYMEVLDKIWADLINPVLFIATEDPKLVREFAEYEPCTASDLGVELVAEELPHYCYLTRDLQQRDPWQLDFYPDFHLLCCSNVLLIPNSTFSFLAAMLAEDLDMCYRSNLRLEGFEAIDPWNEWPMLHDRAEEFPHVEGIADPDNPYYDEDKWAGTDTRYTKEKS